MVDLLATTVTTNFELAIPFVAAIVANMARKPNLNHPVAIIRTALGLTAAQFAKLVGCGKSTINHVETGRPLKVELADQIHLATGVPRGWLDSDKLSLDQVQSWLSSRSDIAASWRLAFGPKPPTSKSQFQVEVGAAGGPSRKGIDVALFDQVLPRMKAVAYGCMLHDINPRLVDLAIMRALEETVSRFKLPKEEIDRLEEATKAHYFGDWDALNGWIEKEAGNPALKQVETYIKRATGASVRRAASSRQSKKRN